MVAVLNDDMTERVGKFDMRIRCSERPAESDASWQRRADVLATWLLDEWKRQQREIAEGN